MRLRVRLRVRLRLRLRVRLRLRLRPPDCDTGARPPVPKLRGRLPPSLHIEYLKAPPPPCPGPITLNVEGFGAAQPFPPLCLARTYGDWVSLPAAPAAAW